ncbi:MAG TPA: BRO family protein [Bacteroidales bacterium]|nr:BRO family protein [Bacteroidales bacterium]
MMEHNEFDSYNTVRLVWDKNNNTWYFVINDIIQALIKTNNPGRYLKELRKEKKAFAALWPKIVTPLKIRTDWGKRNVNCANAQGVIRLILSNPSPRVLTIKKWIVNTGLSNPKKIKYIASNNKRTGKYKKLIYNPEKWIDKQNRTIFSCEDLYLQGKLNDLELIIAMFWDDSLIKSIESFNTKEIQSEIKTGGSNTLKNNYLLCPLRKKEINNKRD